MFSASSTLRWQIDRCTFWLKKKDKRLGSALEVLTQLVRASSFLKKGRAEVALDRITPDRCQSMCSDMDDGEIPQVSSLQRVGADGPDPGTIFQDGQLVVFIWAECFACVAV
jgi:hypothetical protein